MQHGAPIFSLLAAEAGGADLLYAAVPACHAAVARQHCLNAQVHPFSGDDIAAADVDGILELLATVDCAVIGPGLARGPEHLSAIAAIVSGSACPLVLDASALQEDLLALVRKRVVVLTPHAGELERMGIAHDDLQGAARNFGVTILAKGIIDRVASPDGSLREIPGGNAGLTVGGTGDALAGLTAALMAQRVPAADACVMASRVIKGAGDLLRRTKGDAYRTVDVIAEIPTLLRTLTQPETTVPPKGTLFA